jgi:glycerate kinase
MKIVLAFDSYKGSLSAPAACAAAAAGVARAGATSVSLPLSDGGEGFVDALTAAGGGWRQEVTVTGPHFHPVPAEIGWLGDTAVIESAQACGLGLLPPEARHPGRTTTLGVGELLRAAADGGARQIVVGLGGTGTNDGGLGLLQALGWRFEDAHGDALPPVGEALGRVARIVPGTPVPVPVTAACDVRNPLFGPMGAAYVFAPQKGATPDEAAALDAGLRHFAVVCADVLGRDASGAPGAGAAGGLGFALLAFLGATFQPGAALAIALARLDDHLRDADLCLTGEGQTDAQTAFGKLPAAVAARCRAAGVPCVCLSGALGDGWRALYDHGMTAILSITQRPEPLADALAHAADALADTAEAVARCFKTP